MHELDIELCYLPGDLKDIRITEIKEFNTFDAVNFLLFTFHFSFFPEGSYVFERDIHRNKSLALTAFSMFYFH